MTSRASRRLRADRRPTSESSRSVDSTTARPPAGCHTARRRQLPASWLLVKLSGCHRATGGAEPDTACHGCPAPAPPSRHRVRAQVRASGPHLRRTRVVRNSPRVVDGPGARPCRARSSLTTKTPEGASNRHSRFALPTMGSTVKLVVLPSPKISTTAATNASTSPSCPLKDATSRRFPTARSQRLTLNASRRRSRRPSENVHTEQSSTANEQRTIGTRGCELAVEGSVAVDRTFGLFGRLTVVGVDVGQPALRAFVEGPYRRVLHAVRLAADSDAAADSTVHRGDGGLGSAGARSSTLTGGYWQSL